MALAQGTVAPSAPTAVPQMRRPSPARPAPATHVAGPAVSLPAVSDSTRTLLVGLAVGLVVGIGLGFLAFMLGLALAVGRPEAGDTQRDLLFLAPFGVAIVVVLGLLAVRPLRRVGSGILVNVAVGAAATMAVAGGLLAGTGIQRLLG